jgi:hypothetical protein
MHAYLSFVSLLDQLLDLGIQLSAHAKELHRQLISTEQHGYWRTILILLLIPSTMLHVPATERLCSAPEQCTKARMSATLASRPISTCSIISIIPVWQSLGFCLG